MHKMSTVYIGQDETVKIKSKFCREAVSELAGMDKSGLTTLEIMQKLERIVAEKYGTDLWGYLLDDDLRPNVDPG